MYNYSCGWEDSQDYKTQIFVKEGKFQSEGDLTSLYETHILEKLYNKLVLNLEKCILDCGHSGSGGYIIVLSIRVSTVDQSHDYIHPCLT